jgi:molybdate transport system substrate-binding protein
MAEETVSAPVANRYDRMEITGAFGDLGTLVHGVLRTDTFVCWVCRTMVIMSRRKLICRVAVLVTATAVAWGTLQAPAQAQGDDIVIFAAASLTDALDAINAEWQKETGKKATVSYAASSVLAKQIEQDAPAQIFISADLNWMDYVEQKKLIKPESRVNLLGNRLVLIARKDKAQPIEIRQGFDLAKLVGRGYLALADVDSVPAGKYAKAALEKLDVWPSVADKLAQSADVRAALLRVSRGQAPVGIVYQTDAATDPNVTIIGTFPDNTHPPIVYPIALTAKASNPDAAAFYAYLRSAKATAGFEALGFTVLNKNSPN